MNYVINALKIVVNFVLFCFYSLIAIFVENFIFGLIVSKVLDKVVPSQEDPIHFQLAIFTVVLTLILTFVMRKYLYLSFNCNTKWNKSEQSKSKEEEKMEIFIDKEMK